MTISYACENIPDAPTLAEVRAARPEPTPRQLQERAEARRAYANGVVAQCSCVAPTRQFRVSPTVLGMGAIVCGICGDAFQAKG